MSVKDWFHDIQGKFSRDDGAAILEIYLLRRETAIAQLRLLRKRRQLCREPWDKFTLAEGIGILRKVA